MTNRVRVINGLLPTTAWDYVDTKENPADLISRGMKTEEFVGSSFWFNGPDFIKEEIIKFDERDENKADKMEHAEINVVIRSEPVLRLEM